MFIGTCTSTVVDNTTYTYTLSAADLPTASSLLFQKINGDKTTNGYTNTKITDLSNILNNLNSLLQNPNITTYKSSGQLLPVISYKDNLGQNRTLSFDGLILQKSATPDGSLGYFYTGLVTATSLGGTNPTYQYSFENTSTFGQITLYILGDQDSSASSCTTPPTPATVGNFPTNISFTGPRCGYLDCGVGYTQPVCNPTSTTQIKHSGSFIITNNNNAEMLATISSTWTNLDGTALNSLISTVGFTPTGMFSILANSTHKISIGFGLSNYENIIPTEFSSINEIDTYKLLQYCRVAVNYANKATYQGLLKYKPTNDKYQIIGFRMNLLISVLESALKNGFQKIYFHIGSKNKFAIISNVKNPTLGENLFFLLSPLMLRDEEKVNNVGAMDIDYGLELSCIFDLSKNEIVNKDDSIVDFKLY